MAIRNVLIIDDSRTERIYLSEILQAAGFIVTAAESAEQAWLQIEAVKPDLILMDVVMPGTNGYSLTRDLLRDPRYADVPIVICTSKGELTDKIWGMRQGARGYLVKPVSSAELLVQIEALQA